MKKINVFYRFNENLGFDSNSNEKEKKLKLNSKDIEQAKEYLSWKKISSIKEAKNVLKLADKFQDTEQGIRLVNKNYHDKNYHIHIDPLEGLDDWPKLDDGDNLWKNSIFLSYEDVVAQLDEMALSYLSSKKEQLSNEDREYVEAHISDFETRNTKIEHLLSVIKGDLNKLHEWISWVVKDNFYMKLKDIIEEWKFPIKFTYLKEVNSEKVDPIFWWMQANRKNIRWDLDKNNDGTYMIEEKIIINNVNDLKNIPNEAKISFFLKLVNADSWDAFWPFKNAFLTLGLKPKDVDELINEVLNDTNKENKEVQKEWSDFTKSFSFPEYRELFKDSWYNPDLLALYGVFLVEGTLQDDLTEDERQKLKELSDKMGNLKVEKVYCHEPATRDGKCLRKIVFSNWKSIEISNRPPKYRERLLSKIEKMLDE